MTSHVSTRTTFSTYPHSILTFQITNKSSPLHTRYAPSPYLHVIPIRLRYDEPFDLILSSLIDYHPHFAPPICVAASYLSTVSICHEQCMYNNHLAHRLIIVLLVFFIPDPWR